MSRVELRNLDRVMYPATGFTKGDVVAYYEAVAPVLLPHLRGRGLTTARFPEGIDGPGWYQSRCRGHPGWMRTHTVGGVTYCVVDDLDGLRWTANQGALEVHPLLGTIDEPGEPSAVWFDLDPGPPAGLGECARVALLLRERLADAGLASFPKLSGARGLHVVVPLNRPQVAGRAKAFARELAASLAGDRPELVVDRRGRDRRPGRVLVDWAQNSPSRSIIAPYSLRAVTVPRVAAPLAWDEVASGLPVVRPEDVPARLEAVGDPFEDVSRLVQALPGR